MAIQLVTGSLTVLNYWHFPCYSVACSVKCRHERLQRSASARVTEEAEEHPTQRRPRITIRGGELAPFIVTNLLHA